MLSIMFVALSYAAETVVPVSPLPAILPFGDSSRLVENESCWKNPSLGVLLRCRLDIGSSLYLGKEDSYYGYIEYCSSYLKCKELFEIYELTFTGESYINRRPVLVGPSDQLLIFQALYDKNAEAGILATYDPVLFVTPQITFIRDCNVRSGPGTSYEVLFIAKAGESINRGLDLFDAIFTTIGLPDDLNGWIAVHAGAVPGFISPLCYQ